MKNETDHEGNINFSIGCLSILAIFGIISVLAILINSQ